MRHIGTRSALRRTSIYLGSGAFAFALIASIAPGCGDDGTTNNASTASSSSSSSGTESSSSSSSSGAGGAGGVGGQGGTGGAGGAGGSGGAGGGSNACTTPAVGATRGSAIAITPDDKTLVSVNRDSGTVSILSVDYTDGQPKMTKTIEYDLGKGSEPWQVAIDGCGKYAYVVLRRDQKVVRIDDLSTSPKIGPSVNVGSEPTSLALTPNNKKLYVANWVEGTLSVIDPETMTALPPVNLNAALVATTLLGNVTARPALAHPRSLAITNNGDASDDDEVVLATEWFAQRTGPEMLATADTNKKGLVYKVKVVDNATTTLDLPPIADVGFNDHNNVATGCFPNQVGSVTIEGNYAYVTSTCASPKGPLGVFTKGTCTSNAQCGSLGVGSTCSNGLCTLACLQDSDCGFGSPAGTCTLPAGTCKAINTDVKTTTHPALTIIDLTTGVGTTNALDKRFSDAGSLRMPHLPTDIGFFNGFGYLTASGADGVFKHTFDKGVIIDVGSGNTKFIDLHKDANDKLIRLPIGIATAHGANAFAFVANDGAREITAIAFNSQAIAGNPAAMDFRITQASALPAAGTPEDAVLRGKRFFSTGLGRWSLNGEAWGSCAACHIDGLSDNITWYFARGPRQSTSLDGSFASSDPSDQRIFNWTAIVDEIADFEGNTRGVSGGKGAIVDVNDNRINTAAENPPQQGLQGSSDDTADPASANLMHPHSVLKDWKEIAEYIKTIRSPRKPVTLLQADVDAGKAIFTSSGQGNCVGCHSGPKWTISKRFYTPGDIPNAATNDPAATSLSNISWNAALNGFPPELFPATMAAEQRMRFGAPPGAEQIQCALRPVGTFGTSPPEVAVIEKRQDMTTDAQGAAANGNGYNVPSLLGMQVGAPYFHAGNARTLEEVFNDALFKAHHSSKIADVFVMDATKAKQLTAFILSIDEQEPPVAVPAKGATGGVLCFYP